MDEKIIVMLVQLREHVIGECKQLSPNNHAATLTHKEIGVKLSRIVLSLDDVLRPYVKFS